MGYYAQNPGINVTKGAIRDIWKVLVERKKNWYGKQSNNKTYSNTRLRTP